jgi:hypothetical protein
MKIHRVIALGVLLAGAGIHSAGAHPGTLQAAINLGLPASDEEHSFNILI